MIYFINKKTNLRQKIDILMTKTAFSNNEYEKNVLFLYLKSISIYMINFKHKHAVVTGASSGIGAAIAKQLAKEGCNLFLTGLGAQQLLETEKACRDINDVTVYCKECNFSDYSSIDELVTFIKGKNVTIDLFVLNAGISQRAKAFETAFETDQKIMQVNYWSSVYLIKQFREEILASKHTSISVTTSLAGLFGFPLRTSYCSSKHALFGFFESMDLEYDNISVTFLIPGRINTPISKSALMGDGKRYEKMDPGQAKGLDVDIAARKAVKAIKKKKHRKLIGKYELLMAHINRYLPGLYYVLSKHISPT